MLRGKALRSNKLAVGLTHGSLLHCCIVVVVAVVNVHFEDAMTCGSPTVAMLRTARIFSEWIALTLSSQCVEEGCATSNDASILCANPQTLVTEDAVWLAHSE